MRTANLRTRPLDAALGMEIIGADLTRMTDVQMADIADCFDNASALLIRGQNLSPERSGLIVSAEG